MKFKAILNRLTGLSCPIFGISWNPIESEIIIATRIIRYLENRRVLFNPSVVWKRCTNFMAVLLLTSHS